MRYDVLSIEVPTVYPHEEVDHVVERFLDQFDAELRTSMREFLEDLISTARKEAVDEFERDFEENSNYYREDY